MKTFKEIHAKALSLGPKRVALASAADAVSLEAVAQAFEKKLIIPILFGQKEAIEKTAKEHGISISRFDIVDCGDEIGSAGSAVKAVVSGDADILMKGKLQTADFIKAVLNKEAGFISGGLISHVFILEAKKLNRLLLITDGGIVLNPDVGQKADIIRNAIPVAIALGFKKPKVAVVSAVEKVNPKMPETVDAQALVEMNRKGILKDCIVGGPFGMDNALSKEAADLKGIKDPVAGDADIILVPDVLTGNIACKAVMYMADCSFGGLVAGAKAPVIMLSRADSVECKLNSIALGVLASAWK